MAAVGIGGEYVLLMSASFGVQPAVRKLGSFNMLESTLMSLSPTPSFMFVRYEVRSCQMRKLRCGQHSPGGFPNTMAGDKTTEVNWE